MQKWQEAGCDCVVMEVSSQGLMLHRTAGFVFDFVSLRILKPDHIGPNEHKDFDDYRTAKDCYLKQCKVGIVMPMMNTYSKYWKDIPVR